MLQSCFTAQPNIRKRKPKATKINAPIAGNGFEARAFSALWQQSAKLGIAELYRCNSARVDGYIKTTADEFILLEMKESLSWGSTEAAGFQFLAGKFLLVDYFSSPPTRGIIVFERTAKQWDISGPNGALGQLALEAATVANHIVIGALRLGSNGSLHTHASSTP